MPNTSHPTDAAPDAREPDERPSDTEAAHAAQEGKAFGASPARTDPLAGEGRGRDPRPDYGHPTGHSLPGTDRRTAGAEFADRMPDEAVKTSADEAGTRRKSD